MGHYHHYDQKDFRVQEVFEFQSYGLLILDYEGGRVDMWVAQDGDKVAVPTGCHMTLYNLGDDVNPLITLNFANPDENLSNEEFEKQYGPILLGYYSNSEVVFTLNHLYINNPTHNAGVRLLSAPLDELSRQVSLVRGARLNLGQFLYEQFTRNPELISRFARLGITIRLAFPEAILGQPLADRRSALHFWSPLSEITQRSTEVYRYFFSEEPQFTPPPSKTWRNWQIYDEVCTKNDQKKEHTHPLTIVVEGAGNWVETAVSWSIHEESDRRQYGSGCLLCR